MPDKLTRLHVFLAHAGIASRRKAEELIQDGKVRVNGAIVRVLGTQIDPKKDTITFQGKTVQPEEEKILLALHKPRGIVSTVDDPDGKPTVMKFIPKEYRHLRLFPVGRLDEDSEGLILLTNDGDFSYRVTHPKFQVPKTYHAWVHGRLSANEWHRLLTGVPLKDGKTQPAEAEEIDEDEAGQVIAITIKEGRHQQVRRMFEAVNHPVRRLVRVQFGPYELGNLARGQVRREIIRR